MIFIPSRMLEAANGVIVILLLYFLVFLFIHMVRQWHLIHRGFLGRHGWFRSLPKLYRECKPEIALTIFITGLELKTAVLWAARHSANHQNDMRFLHESAAYLLIGGTLLVIVGVVCWNREMVPFRNSYLWWALMILTSCVFGVGMAIL